MDKIPTGDFNKDFKMLEDMCMEVVKDEGGMPSSLFCLNKDLVRIVSGNDFPEESEAKIELLKMIGESLSSDFPDAYGFFFVSEVWMSVKKEGEKVIRPSLDPEKKEALIMLGKKIGGDEKSVIKCYSKKDSKVTFTKEAPWIKEVNAIGWRDSKKQKKEFVNNKMMHELWSSYKFGLLMNSMKK